MRLLIQSKATGRFLVPSGDGGIDWVSSLKEAGGGVLSCFEEAFLIIQEHVDFDDFPQVIDLERLGTVNDYL